MRCFMAAPPSYLYRQDVPSPISRGPDTRQDARAAPAIPQRHAHATHCRPASGAMDIFEDRLQTRIERANTRTLLRRIRALNQIRQRGFVELRLGQLCIEFAQLPWSTASGARSNCPADSNTADRDNVDISARHRRHPPGFLASSRYLAHTLQPFPYRDILGIHHDGHRRSGWPFPVAPRAHRAVAATQS